MRFVLIVLVILLLLGIGGYLTVYRSHDRTGVNLETQKLKRDTERFVDKTKDEWEDFTKKEKHEPAPAPVHP